MKNGSLLKKKSSISWKVSGRFFFCGSIFVSRRNPQPWRTYQCWFVWVVKTGRIFDGTTRWDTWRIIPVTPTKRPFGRGPTTPGLGDLLPTVINHLLNGMILQVPRIPKWQRRWWTCGSQWRKTGRGGSEIICTNNSWHEAWNAEETSDVFWIFVGCFFRDWDGAGGALIHHALQNPGVLIKGTWSHFLKDWWHVVLQIDDLVVLW